MPRHRTPRSTRAKNEKRVDRLANIDAPSVASEVQLRNLAFCQCDARSVAQVLHPSIFSSTWSIVISRSSPRAF
ncbi:MAG: hypothetical protein ACXW4P_32175, partial [Thermoanaerobaculia bacterium]